MSFNDWSQAVNPKAPRRHESRNEAAGIPSEHSAVRSVSAGDFSAEEIRALELRYGAPVRPRAKGSKASEGL